MTPLNDDVDPAKLVCRITVPSRISLKRSCLTTCSSDRTRSSTGCNSRQIQLRGGIFREEMLRLELPGLCIDYGVYKLSASAQKRLSESHYTIGFLLSSDSATSFYDTEIVAGDLVYLPPLSELDVIVGGQPRWILLAIEKGLFESFCHKRLDENSFNRFVDRSAVIVKNSLTTKLNRFVRMVLLSEKEPLLNTDHCQINQSLTEYLLAMCVDVLGTDPSLAIKQDISKQEQIVVAAEKYLGGLSMDRVKVSDLATEINVSVRTLEYAFNEILGITPKRYLKIRRLNFVRQKLLCEPHETVSHHASKAGFWHMAQFSKDYKEMFGESPSETRKRLKVDP